jgi:hypothetical protein
MLIFGKKFISLSRISSSVAVERFRVFFTSLLCPSPHEEASNFYLLLPLAILEKQGAKT